MDEQQSFSHQSLWRMWAIGIVTKDKPFGTDIISVTPMERLPEQIGDLANGQTVNSGMAASPLGGTTAQEVTGSANTQATWVPNGMDHLFTSPMVRANETVQLWKYADKTDLYWTTIFREPGIRRVERFIFAAGNLSTPMGGILDLDSIYSLDVDTLDKKITLKTSISDAEVYGYQFQLNPGESFASLQDNVGRKIVLDSREDNVFMQDVAGSIIESRAGHPRIYGPNGILFETPGQIHYQAGDHLFDGPVRFNDNVDMKKNLRVAAGFSSNYDGTGGRAQMKGGIELEGDMIIEQGLTVLGYANFPGGHGPHPGG